MNSKGKIAVAVSGGVDSSIAALLLKNEGYDVVGVNLTLWSCFKSPERQSCCSPEDRRDARAVCEAIGIKYVTIDMREEFKRLIVEPFVKEYWMAKTPNPCIRCNTVIKFGRLFEWINENLSISRLATGHYARILNDSRGMHLLKGIDTSKDQSYFLYEIRPDRLKDILFPIGDMEKREIRKIAKESDLPVAEKPESQEICFVPGRDYGSFIEDYYPDYARSSGTFVDSEGKVVGRHRGTHNYTIGQRRGLGIGFGERMYVTGIDPEKREIVLGADEDLMRRGCRLENLNMIEDVGECFKADVKIRYRSDLEPALIKIDNKRAEIEFERPVRAIAPGQAAVFYDGDMVLGGGWIVG